MIEHSSTPENLHSPLIEDAGMGLQMPFGETLGNESYARLDIVV